MATYPSGVSGHLPLPGSDTASWGAQLDLAMDDQPIGQSAPCLNPECAGPVDYVPSVGPGLLYCSRYCRNRTAALRGRINQQLEVIAAALGPDYRSARGLPRAALKAREAHLRWWLARLSPETNADRALRSR